MLVFSHQTVSLDTHEIACSRPQRFNDVRLARKRPLDILDVADVDILDGTPLLDIKPYLPELDSYPASKAGWLDKSRSRRRLADDRFESQPPVTKPKKR